ncbi:MAG: hypothetical protein A2126_03680 [Candidatus Woykebacteria bacterium GWB1_45_5]|uniref:Phosphoglycerate mutase n=2 Tax=Candidatus Woykeibacteriota TaxID=1817899 RepID=A0A1G1W089_9BACT|nr:MAG: hypothetical protein A2113_02990 [Candidatus Woykebacteria bacterium GWA1_44_8]OGY23359.1 MAG: hypothetical protein A2126_03680 [Candidatus Woykebacteria bacterium GWB1_45_5]
MSTTVYYVRHAPYENPERLVPGRIPGYHLGSDGKEKARKVGEFFKGKPINYIYTSPLERTFETANIIGEQLPGAKIIHVYDLIEIESTSWQAFRLEELFTNEYYESFLNDPATDKVIESLNKLAARIKNLTLTLCAKHKDEEIICVSHEYPILALRLTLEGKPLNLLKTYNVSMGSITTFVFDETCHFLKDEYLEII